PDLPPGTEWPVFWNYPHMLDADRPEQWSEELGPWPPFYLCKPLTFLAQIDLAEIACVGSPIIGLRESGLLSVFSVWGWEDNSETCLYDVPIDDDQEGGNAVIYTPPSTDLKRFRTPGRVNSCTAAAVDPIPILTLGGSSDQP